MDEIYTFSRSSDHVDESKSTRLPRFRLMLGEIVRSFRSWSKIGKSSEIISAVQFLQRITWNWWRTGWARVEYFPRTSFIGNLSDDPKESARSRHWTWTFWRTNYLLVDKERKFRKVYFEFRTSQELREQFLARTLVILRPRWWRKMVRNAHQQTWTKIGFHRNRNGGTFQRNWTPSIHEHECF